jgi:heterodisulfide reductase subunit B
MRFGLFLGCNIPLRRPDLEYALRYIYPKLGVELVDLEGASCCPTWGTMPSVDLAGWCAVSARNMCIAEEKGVDILTVCGSCYGSLSETRHKMLHNPEIRDEVNRMLGKIGREWKGTSQVRHGVWVLYKDIGLDKIKESIKYRLDGLTIAVQPGCHFLWPSEVYVDKEKNPFRPRVLIELCEAIGAEAPDFSTITDCCGTGGLRSTNLEKSLKLFERKIKSIKEEIDPDLVVTSCSSCLLQYDGSVKILKEKGRINFEIPTLHFVQLLAICLGANPDQVAGLAVTGPEEVIKKIRGEV